MNQSYLSWVGVALVLAGVAIVTGHPGWGILTGAVLVLTGAGIVVGTGRSASSDEPKAQRVSNSLVTLSSAAIIAVYAAGFHRTKAAADEFEAQAARRRAHPRPPAALVQKLSQQPTQALVTAPPQLVASSVQPSPAPAPSPAKKSRPQRATPTSENVPPAAAPDSTSPPAFAPAQSEPPRPQEAVAAPTAPPTAPDAQSPAAAPAASAAPTSPIPAAVPGQVPAPADPQTRPSTAVAEGALVMPKLLYKDGTFEGLGKSAHGNIRASVVVQGGRIASTAIVKCETAYSCDWIAKLPPQVVATQDPATIDIVTGASDSSYAFQDAVTAALFRAQRGE